MIPKSLSASAMAKFHDCPAGYRAEWIEPIPDESGSAATLGTTCHSALEVFVESGQAQAGAPVGELHALFEKFYWANFSDDDRLAEGLAMMTKWHERQDWTGVEVISTEKKEFFDLPTSAGPIRFNFIWDRCDRLADGSIKIVDYKSNFIPLTHEDLLSKIQPRVYGMAARMKFPDAPSIWVEFDFLRHDTIGVKSLKEQNRATYEFLKDAAEEILASDGTEERVNAGCRYCVRRHVCGTIQKHVDGGGKFSVGWVDANDAVHSRARLDNAKKAIEAMISDIDAMVVAHMEKEGITEFSTPEAEVKISASRRRAVDSEIVAKIVGADVFAKYSTIAIGKLEKLLKDEPLTPEQATAVTQQIRWQFNRVGLKINPKGPLEDDD